MARLPHDIVFLVQSSGDLDRDAARRVGQVPEDIPGTTTDYVRYRAVARSDRRIEIYQSWTSFGSAERKVDEYTARHPEYDVYMEIAYGHIERWEGN